MTIHARHVRVFAFLLGCPGCAPGDATNDDGSDSTGGGASTAQPSSSSSAEGGPSEGGPSESGGSEAEATSADESGSEGGSSDTGEEPPPPAGVCNDDGQCAFPETCSTCPDECGSCDVDALPGQRAKYVDLACDQPGDGLVDACAEGAGMPGRFVDLQVAIDSLVAGDTLYVHPGDYYREGDGFRVAGFGTAEAPIVITAAVPDEPPVIHSWDPSAPDDNARSHVAISGAEQDIAWIVIDNLRIEGLIAFHGDHTRLQNLECTHGWEGCDGNWSCIRMEGCVDCVAHHNWVHDVADTTNHCNGKNPPRESGLKEFSCTRSIWELNTIEDTAQWGYDLHRSSTDSIARYNLFRNAGPFGAIRMNRTGNMSVIGNVVVGGGTCVELVPEDPGDGFTNRIEHNACLFTGAGLYFNGFTPTTVTDNVFGWLGPSDADRVMIAASAVEDGVPHTVDHNAYDASSRWTTELYEAPYLTSLDEWRESTEYDDASIAEPGGPCSFVDAPSDAADADFDLTIADGACAELGVRGGAVGACAVTSCVGHDCSGCGF